MSACAGAAQTNSAAATIGQTRQAAFRSRSSAFSASFFWSGVPEPPADAACPGELPAADRMVEALDCTSGLVARRNRRIPRRDTQQQRHARERQYGAKQEEIEPADLLDDPSGRRVDQRSRDHRKAGEERELRRGVARMGGASNERDERRRGQTDAERFEADNARQQHAVRTVLA